MMEVYRQESEERVVFLDASEIEKHWIRMIPFIQRVLDREKKYRVDDIRDGLIQGGLKGILFERSGRLELMLIGASIDHGLKRSFQIFLVSGENIWKWMRWFPMIEKTIEEWGFPMIEVIGRRGWSRLLPEYRQTGIILEKEFSHG